MDAILDGWRREMPDLDRPEFYFAKRVARLDQLLEEALSRCLAPWNLVIADHNVLAVLRTAGVPYELRGCRTSGSRPRRAAWLPAWWPSSFRMRRRNDGRR